MGKFNSFKEEADYYHRRSINADRQLETLKTEKGLDAYKKKCEKEAEERNRELNTQLRKAEASVKKLLSEVESRDTRIADLTAKNTAMSGDLRACKRELDDAKKQLRKALEEIENLTAENRQKEESHSGDQAKIQELEKQVTSLGGAVESMKHKAQKDSQTSSSPTSFNPDKKPIQNGRVKTGKPQGAQTGHPHHARKITEIPGKAEGFLWGENDPLWKDPDYSFTEFKVKHVYMPCFRMEDRYFLVPEFRHVRTGAHKCAGYPSWMKDEKNYSPEAKAILGMMTLFTNMSCGNCKTVVETLSYGQFSPSTGFISGLSVEFALKTEPERAYAFRQMLGPGVMNVDGTTIRVGGQQYAVSICVSGPYTLYYFRSHKGKKLVEGTPIELTSAILIHDHDVTYYNYGKGHQECLEHVCRYLRDSVVTEGEYQWNTKMLDFVTKLMHMAKEADKAHAEQEKTMCEDGVEFVESGKHPRFDEEMIETLKKEYLRILEDGLQEYKEKPNKTWYTDGKNLCRRLFENPDAYLAFMEDDRISYTNNTAEREARQIKRKQACATTFRGFLGVIAYCESMSVVRMLKKDENKDILAAMTEIFARESTAADELRMQKERASVLEGVCEKDGDRMNRSQAELKAMEDLLPKIKENEETARKKYIDAAAKRAAASGKDSKPSEEEEALDRAARKADRAVYDLEMRIRSQKKTVEKNVRDEKNHKEELEKTRSRIQSLEVCIAKQKEAEEKKAAEGRKDTQTKSGTGRIVDPERVSAAENSVRALKEKLNDAYSRLSCAYEAYHSAAHPAVDPGSASRKSVLNADGSRNTTRKASDDQLKAMLEAIEKIRKEIDALCDELNIAQGELDDARKGRRPGRRARRKAAAQTADTRQNQECESA